MFEKEVTVTISRENAPAAEEAWLGEYTIRRWTWREKQQAVVDTTKIVDKTRGIGEINVIDYDIKMMLICIQKAPLELTAEKFDTVDVEVGDILLNATRRVNGQMTDKEARDFLGPSDSEEDTPS